MYKTQRLELTWLGKENRLRIALLIGMLIFEAIRERYMTEPMITCPKCQTEIKLTESLAAPIVESARREYEQRLAQKDADIAKRETSLRKREKEIAQAKEAIDDQVAEKLRQERARIVAEEYKKAKLALATDLEQKEKGDYRSSRSSQAEGRKNLPRHRRRRLKS